MKEVDIFGEPIRLMFKGKPTIPSCFGGFVTIVVCLLMSAYATGKFRKVELDNNI